MATDVSAYRDGCGDLTIEAPAVPGTATEILTPEALELRWPRCTSEFGERRLELLPRAGVAPGSHRRRRDPRFLPTTTADPGRPLLAGRPSGTRAEPTPGRDHRTDRRAR